MRATTTCCWWFSNFVMICWLFVSLTDNASKCSTHTRTPTHTTHFSGLGGTHFHENYLTHIFVCWNFNYGSVVAWQYLNSQPVSDLICFTHRHQQTLWFFENPTATEESTNGNKNTNTQEHIERNVIMIIGLCHGQNKGGICQQPGGGNNNGQTNNLKWKIGKKRVSFKGGNQQKCLLEWLLKKDEITEAQRKIVEISIYR